MNLNQPTAKIGHSKNHSTLTHELSPPAKDGTVRQPIMKYQYRKDLLNTIMANVDVGTFKGDEFYVPLKTVEGQSKTEVEV